MSELTKGDGSDEEFQYTTDEDTLKAAPKTSVIEVGTQLGKMPMYEIHHYEHGKPTGWSIARGDEITEWLRDLRGAGHMLALGWELRGQPAPDGFPGEAP